MSVIVVLLIIISVEFVILINKKPGNLIGNGTGRVFAHSYAGRQKPVTTTQMKLAIQAEDKKLKPSLQQKLDGNGLCLHCGADGIIGLAAGY